MNSYILRVMAAFVISIAGLAFISKFNIRLIVIFSLAFVVSVVFDAIIWRPILARISN